MKRPRIFLLDDDAAFRHLISAALARAGCEPVEIPRIGVARGTYRSGAFDLLIVDGLLPDGSGIAWLEEVRQSGDTTPAIFVSAFWKDMRTFTKLTRDLHVAAVMAKPLAPAELVQAVLAALSESARGSPFGVSETGSGGDGVKSQEDDEIILGTLVSDPALGAKSDKPVSDMGDRTLAESELRRLLEAYAGALPEKWSLLSGDLDRLCANPGDAGLRATAHRSAHKLHGTAGSYGFKELSKAAAMIEGELGAEDETDWKVIHAAIDEGRRHLPSREEEYVAVLPPAAVATILVVDEDPVVLEEMRALGRDMMVATITAQTAEDALDAAAAQKLDGAIVSTRVALNHSDGNLDLIDSIRAVADTPGFPVALMARPDEDSMHDRISASFTGTASYIRKPVAHSAFAALIRQFLAYASRDRARVLIVDNEAFSLLAHFYLQSAGIQVAVLNDAAGILHELDEFKPDLVMLDIFLPGVTGFEVAHVLRMDPRWRDVALVIVSACADDASRLAAFKAGADDFIAKPIARDDFLARVRSHLDRVRSAREARALDTLTGLPERVTFIDEMNRLIEGGRATQVTIGLLAADGLKSINEAYGYEAGDRVLMCLAGVLGRRLRPADLRARWAGAEFAVVFHNAEMADAAEILRRVAREFASYSFEGAGLEPFTVTLSYGIASAPADGSTATHLLSAAEARLVEDARIHRAKQAS